MKFIYLIFSFIFTLSLNAQVVISPNGITGGTINNSTNSDYANIILSLDRVLNIKININE